MTDRLSSSHSKLIESNGRTLRLRQFNCEDCWREAIKPGQVWEDTDLRPAGRRLRVLSVHPRVITNPAYVRLENVETGRESGVQLWRLVRRFKLVEVPR